MEFWWCDKLTCQEANTSSESCLHPVLPYERYKQFVGAARATTNYRNEKEKISSSFARSMELRSTYIFAYFFDEGRSKTRNSA